MCRYISAGPVNYISFLFTRLPPYKVEIEKNGNEWVEMSKVVDGYWVYQVSDGIMFSPLNNIPVRITGINGEVLLDTVPMLGRGFGSHLTFCKCRC